MAGPQRASWAQSLAQAMPQASDEAGLLGLLGGPRGLVDAGLPGAVFGVVYGLTGRHLATALAVALGCGALLFVVGLIQRRPVTQALTGLVGVGVMAGAALLTHKASNFYLPSILKNAGYALAYLLSVVVRWPLLGLLLGPLMGEGLGWRQDPRRLRAYSQASLVWAAMFALRLAIQLPLYLSGRVAALGVAGVLLGIPPFLAAGWATLVILRRTPRVVPRDGADATPVTGDGEAQPASVAGVAPEVAGAPGDVEGNTRPD